VNIETYPYNLALSLRANLVRHAERPALRRPEGIVTFRDLGGQVERLGGWFLRQGLRQGDVVAIGNTKKPAAYAAMLAGLSLGMPYVNLDVFSPLERNKKILETSRPALLAYDDPASAESMHQLAAAAGIPSFCLDPLPGLEKFEVTQREWEIRSGRVDGDTIAYVMFTSGSTGTPKGVAVTHQNVLHFIEWAQRRFQITASDNFANLSPMYFDNSVFDFFVGLFSGASLTPIGRDLLQQPYALVEHVARMGCTVWFSVPSLLMYLMTMKALAAEKLPQLRTILFGGEGYPKAELSKLYRMFSPRAELVNVYGPTECTCICSAHTLGDADFVELAGLPTLGKLNPNFDYRILDEGGRDASSGELCLIGPNVAAGYFNDPERTKAAFQTLTEPGRFGKRMYRTGDLVRETDGRLDFLGRKDNQIKHMGYRIELEEIEHAVVRLEQVDQAAVFYDQSNPKFGKIVAYAASHRPPPEAQALRELEAFLPAYMIPSRIHFLGQLPKNKNGKVDREKLRSLFVNS